MIFFNNTGYQAADHYSLETPIQYQFKNASLQVVKQKDSVYLAGNIQLWSVNRKEPEKPLFISLVKKSDGVRSISTLAAQSPEVKNAAITEFIVYPNPFAGSVQVNFSLEQDGNVGVNIADLSGRIVYSNTSKRLTAGKQSLTLQPVLPEGIYVLKLNCNGATKATLVIKQ